MKIYSNKKFQATTVRMIKTDDGKELLAVFGTAEDLFRLGLLQDMPYEAWAWVLFLQSSIDRGDAVGLAFDSRDELLSFAKEHLA